MTEHEGPEAERPSVPSQEHKGVMVSGQSIQVSYIHGVAEDVPIQKDAAFYEEVRQAVGRGAPTLLLGTSTRSLQRSLGKLKAVQQGESRSSGLRPEVISSNVPAALVIALAGAGLALAAAFTGLITGSFGWVAALPTFVLCSVVPLRYVIRLHTEARATRMPLNDMRGDMNSPSPSPKPTQSKKD